MVTGLVARSQRLGDGPGTMARIDSTEYPDDYIEIVNEINDFIASLDGVPGEPTPHSCSGLVPGVVIGGAHHHHHHHHSGGGGGIGSGSYAGVGGYSGGGGSSGSSDAGYGGSNSTTASRGPSEFLSPYSGVHLGDSRFSVDSLEHDYEPIENLVVVTPPPTPPRKPATAAAAAGSHPVHPRKMADGQPKHVKAIYNFKGTNNDEVSAGLLWGQFSSDTRE